MRAASISSTFWKIGWKVEDFKRRKRFHTWIAKFYFREFNRDVVPLYSVLKLRPSLTRNSDKQGARSYVIDFLLEQVSIFRHLFNWNSICKVLVKYSGSPSSIKCSLRKAYDVATRVTLNFDRRSRLQVFAYDYLGPPSDSKSKLNPLLFLVGRPAWISERLTRRWRRPLPVVKAADRLAFADCASNCLQTGESKQSLQFRKYFWSKMEVERFMSHCLSREQLFLDWRHRRPGVICGSLFLGQRQRPIF